MEEASLSNGQTPLDQSSEMIQERDGERTELDGQNGVPQGRRNLLHLLWEWSLSHMMMPTTITFVMRRKWAFVLGRKIHGSKETAERSTVLYFVAAARVSKE